MCARQGMMCAMMRMCARHGDDVCKDEDVCKAGDEDVCNCKAEDEDVRQGMRMCVRQGMRMGAWQGAGQRIKDQALVMCWFGALLVICFFLPN